MKTLKDEMVVALAKKLGKKGSTVKKDIYLLRKSYPSCTLNAVAQIYAQTYGKTVFRKLDKEDRQSLPHLSVQKPVTIRQKSPRPKRTERKMVSLITYNTGDHFRSGHLKEINRAYTYGCYTAVFILLRKIVENMLIDILRHKFPPTTLENKRLYFDPSQKRFKDFSQIVANLRAKSADFDVDKKLVERIASLSTSLKDKANDKAHSWFHLVTRKSEIDELDSQTLIQLISQLERNIGMK